MTKPRFKVGDRVVIANPFHGLDEYEDEHGVVESYDDRLRLYKIKLDRQVPYYFYGGELEHEPLFLLPDKREVQLPLPLSNEE